jgi:hypothetical protein
MRSMKSLLLVQFAAGAVLAGTLSAGLAHADVRIGVNVGIPAPVYVAPPAVYAPPPPPVIYQPGPVYARPPAIGWYGNRYYDGRRYWNRNDWYRYHGHRGGPPHNSGGHGHGHGHGNPHR